MSLIRFSQVSSSLYSRIFLFIFFIFLSAMHVAMAHELHPAIINIDIQTPDTYQVKIQANVEAWIANVGPEHDDTDASPNAAHYNALRRMPPAKLKQSYKVYQPMLLNQLKLLIGDRELTHDVVDIAIPAVGDERLSRISVITLKGTLPKKAEPLQWIWAENLGAYALIITKNNKEIYTLYQAKGGASDAVDYKEVKEQSASTVFVNYVVAGFTHIIPKGLDHILFVISLFLLSVQFRPLLWQVTSFTIAHSITLMLGMMGLITLPSMLVEALIALSIVYVAVENIFLKTLSVWRPFVIFGFGLLHGLGFASVLDEFGLQSEHFFAGLLGFNVGVELGQLAVIALCVLFVGLWFRNKPWYRLYITIPASLLIAMIGTYWFFERVSFV